MPQTTHQEITVYLLSLADPEIAEHSQRFFKTAEGEYGAGDRFLGIRVPVLRRAVKTYKGASLETADRLLHSEFHEVRLFALLLLVRQFSSQDEEKQAQIFALYLDNTNCINNWDLVDSSAAQIVGTYLYKRKRDKLYQLCQSDSIWERRIAIIASFHFIRNEQYGDTLKIARCLLQDEHDLIHKAVGWMLREVGKRDLETELGFLNTHYRQMPRTMLRYAIEKLDPVLRQQYLKGNIQTGYAC